MAQKTNKTSSSNIIHMGWGMVLRAFIIIHTLTVANYNASHYNTPVSGSGCGFPRVCSEISTFRSGSTVHPEVRTRRCLPTVLTGRSLSLLKHFDPKQWVYFRNRRGPQLMTHCWSAWQIDMETITIVQLYELNFVKMIQCHFFTELSPPLPHLPWKWDKRPVRQH